MEHEILRTASGKEFKSDYLAVIPSPEQAFIRILEKSLPDVAAVFCNPSETVQLWHGQHYLAQYTKLVYICQEEVLLRSVSERSKL